MDLPYIILHAIQLSGPNDRKEIGEEFATVANSVQNSSNKNDDNFSESRISYTNYKMRL